MSSSSTSNNSRSMGVKCHKCGADSKVRYSSTQKNPGRPYLACEGGCGFVKWFDPNNPECNSLTAKLLNEIEAQHALIREYENQRWKDIEAKTAEEVMKWKTFAEVKEKEELKINEIVADSDSDEVDFVKCTYEDADVGHVTMYPWEHESDSEPYSMTEYDLEVAATYDPTVLKGAWCYESDSDDFGFYNPYEDEEMSDDLSSRDDYRWK